ncbi:quercetin dioxygenase-like cupin family protein [Bradyrhizobium sp. GM22.5]
MEGRNVTLARWLIEPGRQPTGIHSHDDHEQFTIVISGSIETLVGDELLTLAAGDVCHIPPGTEHGQTLALNGESAILIDVFEPVRSDYVQAAKSGEHKI